MNGAQALPQDAALADAAKAVQAAAGVEETRFNNLNARAISLLSATSLVTALAGFFSKDLLSTTSLEQDRRQIAAWLLILTVVALVAVAGVLVFRVLLPSRRALFGANDLTDQPGALANADDVNKVLFVDYLAILNGLQERNSQKVDGLHLAYVLYLLAVVIIAAGVVVVASQVA